MGDNEKPVLSVEELADMLGIGMNSCYALIKEGHFRTVRVGRRILIPKECVKRWLNDGDKSTDGAANM